MCSITSKQEFEAADEDADNQSDDEVPPPPDGSDPFIADDSFILTPDLRQAIDKAVAGEGPEGLSQESFKAWAGKVHLCHLHYSLTHSPPLLLPRRSVSFVGSQLYDGAGLSFTLQSPSWLLLEHVFFQGDANGTRDY